MLLRRFLPWTWLALCLVLPMLGALTLGGAQPGAREAARPGFTGSATCAGCHAAEAAAWRGSDHARAMAPATPATVLGDFSGAEASGGGQQARFKRSAAGGFVVQMEGQDLAVSETFGVDPLQQYLVQMPDSRRQALPWAWDVAGKRWYHLLPGETLRPGDQLHWAGRDQNWNFMCSACHATGLERGYDATRDAYDTRWVEQAVGCEGCHGPGATHVAWAQGTRNPLPGKGLTVPAAPAGAWRGAERSPRGIAQWEGPPRGTAELESCAPCHARARPIEADPLPGQRFLDGFAPALLTPGLYHANGQIEGEVFEWGSFVQSRMQRAGVTCSDCHEPHGGKLRAEGNAVCAQCHLPARFDSVEHHHHRPGSPAAQCTSCHMPTVTYMGIDRRHDHAFRVPRPDVAAAVGAPEVCSGCHAGKTPAWAAAQLAAWFGPPQRDQPHPALAIQAGRRGEPGADSKLAPLVLDRSQPAILRATALGLLPARPTQLSAQAIGGSLRDPEPLVRAAALRALEGLPPRNRLQGLALLEDPVRLVRIEAARLLAPVPLEAMPEAARPAFARAWEELLASERVAAERPEAHVNIAGLLAARGDAAGAEAAYRAALARDAGFLPALVNFADFAAVRGNATEATALLRQAIATNPTRAEPHYALALLAVRRGDTTAALAPLAEAARLAPEVPRYAYAQALALNGLGRGEEARAVLRASLARTPRDRDSLMALATMERDRGAMAEAEKLAAQAATLDPADREAQALLQQLRGRR